MIKCKIYFSFNYTSIEQIVEHCYKEYEVVDVKFSTAMDVTFNREKYSVMIIYKEKK